MLTESLVSSAISTERADHINYLQQLDPKLRG